MENNTVPINPPSELQTLAELLLCFQRRINELEMKVDSRTMSFNRFAAQIEGRVRELEKKQKD